MTNQPTTTKEALEPCPFHVPDADWPPMLVRFPNRALDKDVWCVKCAECEARTATYTSADTARGKWNSRASAPIIAPVVDEDRELAERLRALLLGAFITGHMHGPSSDYQVQLKFRTLKASQQCQTLIEALAHPEYRESFIRQGVLEHFAAPASPVALPRHYFCSCGGALTAEEYIDHYFEKGHDRGDPALLAKAAATEWFVKRGEKYPDTQSAINELAAIIERCLTGGE